MPPSFRRGVFKRYRLSSLPSHPMSIFLICFLLYSIVALGKLNIDASAVRFDSNSSNTPSTLSNSDRHIGVIGAGYAGLTAALEMRLLGYNVTVFEKLPRVGGRVNHFDAKSASSNQLLRFGEGPSWYAMPDLMDAVFARYHAPGRAALYNVTRMDPSYRIRLPNGKVVDVPGTLEGIYKLAGPAREPGLRRFFEDARYKYEKGIADWLWRPMVSPTELISPDLFWAALSADMFGGYEAHVRRHISSNEFVASSSSASQSNNLRNFSREGTDLTDEDWVTILKWPVIFLGASPRDAPAMYSMITYALHALGIWWPEDESGMSRPALALAQVARLNGVRFELDAEIESIQIDDFESVSALCIRRKNCARVDGLIAAADYEHVEQNLLPARLRRYDSEFWHQATLSPSCLIFHLGFDQPATPDVDHPVTALFESVLQHHTYFFDVDLNAYLRAVFDEQAALTNQSALDTMSFYVSAPHPPAMMVLLPISFMSNGTDTVAVRKQILSLILRRLTLNLPPKARAKISSTRSSNSSNDDLVIQPSYVRMYGTDNYTSDFNAFRGNAFGLANTMSQSLLWRPSLNGRASNMVFAGHMTTPGPGVPPAMVSGISAARLLHQKLQSKSASSLFFSWPSFADSFLFSAILQNGFVLKVSLVTCLILFITFEFIRLCMRWPSRSQWACLRLFYVHGSTFFAASTLMTWRAFWDTAALYALFRAADDCVDQVGVPAQERRALLARFEAAFWRGLDGFDDGDSKVDAILPAVVEACRRLQYPRRLFELFFESMHADCTRDDGKFECKTMQETCKYMEGSAAVIGEFMLPILLDGIDEAERFPALEQELRDAARALGNAFQLTNMIRDVEEDRSLGRQYLPGGIMSGEISQIEEAMKVADQYYLIADQGIAALPSSNGARDVVQLARHMYSGIHQAIRDQQYDLHQRARITPLAKLKLALRYLNPRSVAQLVTIHLLAMFVSQCLQHTAPILVLLLAIAAPLYAPTELTYGQFHYVFTLPAISILWSSAYFFASSSSQLEHVRRFFWWSVGMCAIATIYTTPWDNALVWNNVWGYPSQRPLWGVLGWVPLEEYAFFSIETLIVAGIWLAAFPVKVMQSPPIRRSLSPVHNIGRVVLVVFFLVGLRLYPLYMGRILTWAAPVLAIQWEFGSYALVAHVHELSITIVFASVSLCILDAWAIADGIWAISPEHLLVPKALTFGLPLEEGAFFVLTSCMCAGGLTLAMLVDHHHRARQASWYDSLWAIHRWGAKDETFSSPDDMTERANNIHSALIVASIAAILLFKDAIITSVDEIVFLVIGVALIGIPHGALDGIFLTPSSTPKYLFGVMSTICFWTLQPAFALIAFLLLSIWHFGEGDVQPERLCLSSVVEIIARGGLTLVSIYRHPAQCFAVFRILVGSGNAEMVLNFILDWVIPLHFVCILFTLLMYTCRLHQVRRGWLALSEFLSVWALFVFASPLLAFGIYFIFIHSARHVLRVWLQHSQTQTRALQQLQQPRDHAKSLWTSALVNTAPVLAVAVLFIWFASRFRADSLVSFVSQDVLRVTFIGLSALTTPHAVLVWQQFSCRGC